MRGLARFLHIAGYTCYAPNYAGHGESPEHLFASTIDEIWESVEEAVSFLRQEGHDSIYVIGQSLGGVMALRLSNDPICQGLILLSTPVLERTIEGLEHRLLRYTERYFQFENRTKEWITDFTAVHFPRPEKNLIALQQFILQTQMYLPEVTQPVALFKGALDDAVYHASIDLIEARIASRDQKRFYYRTADIC